MTDSATIVKQYRDSLDEANKRLVSDFQQIDPEQFDRDWLSTLGPELATRATSGEPGKREDMIAAKTHTDTIDGVLFARAVTGKPESVA